MKWTQRKIIKSIATLSKRSNAQIATQFKNHRRTAKTVGLSLPGTFARCVICSMMIINANKFSIAKVVESVELEDEITSTTAVLVECAYRTHKRIIINVSKISSNKIVRYVWKTCIHPELLHNN